MSTDEPRAYMRRWAYDGITPERVLNPKTNRMHLPFQFCLHEVTRNKCLPDDVPLYAKEESPK